MDYEIGDIVHSQGMFLEVVGVVHDSEKLFLVDITNTLNKGKEFCIFFEEVTSHYKNVNSSFIEAFKILLNDYKEASKEWDDDWCRNNAKKIIEDCEIHIG